LVNNEALEPIVNVKHAGAWRAGVPGQVKTAESHSILFVIGIGGDPGRPIVRVQHFIKKMAAPETKSRVEWDHWLWLLLFSQHD
jgi:hypothetical protein